MLEVRISSTQHGRAMPGIFDARYPFNLLFGDENRPLHFSSSLLLLMKSFTGLVGGQCCSRAIIISFTINEMRFVRSIFVDRISDSSKTLRKILTEENSGSTRLFYLMGFDPSQLVDFLSVGPKRTR